MKMMNIHVVDSVWSRRSFLIAFGRYSLLLSITRTSVTTKVDRNFNETSKTN